MEFKSEAESLKRRLAEAEENLRLIRERKSEFVQQTDIPLQLIKDERRLEQEIEALQTRLAQETVEEDTSIRALVSRCPWANAWNDGDLVPYGRLYCQEIDKALVRGFNPELVIDVNSTLTNDGKPCEFVFHQAAKPAGDTLIYIQENAARITEQSVMPWEYHCGHLYKTFGEALTGDSYVLALDDRHRRSRRVGQEHDRRPACA